MPGSPMLSVAAVAFTLAVVLLLTAGDASAKKNGGGKPGGGDPGNTTPLDILVTVPEGSGYGTLYAMQDDGTGLTELAPDRGSLWWLRASVREEAKNAGAIEDVIHAIRLDADLLEGWLRTTGNLQAGADLLRRVLESLPADAAKAVKTKLAMAQSADTKDQVALLKAKAA